MSKLSIVGRPWVAFDENNSQHRKWYFEFVKYKTWGRVPVRFIVPDDHGDLVSMIQSKLIRYYTETEFG